MATRTDLELDRLAKELVELQRETRDLTRNYSIEDAYAMQNGVPRDGSSANERIAREKFARMREIEAVINIHHGN